MVIKSEAWPTVVKLKSFNISRGSEIVYRAITQIVCSVLRYIRYLGILFWGCLSGVIVNDVRRFSARRTRRIRGFNSHRSRIFIWIMSQLWSKKTSVVATNWEKCHNSAHKNSLQFYTENYLTKPVSITIFIYLYCIFCIVNPFYIHCKWLLNSFFGNQLWPSCNVAECGISLGSTLFVMTKTIYSKRRHFMWK